MQICSILPVKSRAVVPVAVLALVAGVALGSGSARAESIQSTTTFSAGPTIGVAECWTCGAHYDDCVANNQSLTRCVRDYVECRKLLCEGGSTASGQVGSRPQSAVDLLMQFELGSD